MSSVEVLSQETQWRKIGQKCCEKNPAQKLEEGDEVEVFWRNQLDSEQNWFPGKISSINWDEFFVVDFCVAGKIETDVFEKNTFVSFPARIFEKRFMSGQSCGKPFLGRRI
ncbi:Oidioi.mRNA.OKI2018_I69.chr1.g1097.t1.cds [Oikopleura dioica]|uniref:Oidioi.mRNA.OKI2018_I69.chr1.g1097.t1.cds n=1 Tax=Oikopleura dioica TaxID=34765 RepID=A0ABN7SR49_OIKDI|nr:Oidioi.mRNA.OKI2018_I69.chr1.g1097.t1.cds [Oikopleura dioica]